MTDKTKHEADLKRHEWELNERIKELTCLHELGRVVEQADLSVEAFLGEAVLLLPPAWQFPDDTAVRITHGASCFQAGDFPKTALSLLSPLSVDGCQVGTVEVAYRHEHPAADEGPFLKEERALLDTFTQRLGLHVKQIQAQEEVRAANQQLRATEQHLRAVNQQFEAANQQVRAMEQQLRAANQQLRATNQQLRATEQQLRASNQALMASEELLNETGDMARVGGWEIDLNNDTVRWTRTAKAIHEVPDDYVPTLEEAINFFPDAKDEITGAVRRARDEGVPYDMEVPFTTAKGRKRWTRTIGKPEFRDGKCVRLHGTFQDITVQKQMEAELQKREEELRVIVENSTNLFYSHTPDHVLTYLSPQVKDILGYEVEEALKCWTDMATDHPDNTRAFQLTEQAIHTGETQPTYELQLTHKEGHPVWVEVHESPCVQDGKTVAIIGSLTDISERKRAEATLRATERRNQALLDYSPVCHKIVDLDFNLQYMSRNGFRMLGFDEAADIYGKPYPFEFFPETFRHKMTEALERVKATGETLVLEAVTNNIEGTPVCLCSTLVPVPDEEGNLDYITVVSADVTEERNAQAALREADIRYREIVRGGRVGLWDWNLITNSVYYSPEWKSLVGYQDHEIGDSLAEWRERVHPDDLPGTLKYVEQMIDKCAENYTTEFRFRHKDGSWLWIQARASVMTNDSGEAERVVGSHLDITEVKQREAELAEAKAMLQAAMDNSTAGIAIADAPSGKLRYVNDAGLLIRGSDRAHVVNGIGADQYVQTWKILELDGTPLDTDQVPLTRAVKYGETNEREFIIRRADGDDRVVLARAAPIMHDDQVVAGIVVFLDITERKDAELAKDAAEAKLRQSERLEAIGQLAGGVAHDFNNLLMGIMNYVELCRDGLEPVHPIREWLDEITADAQRSADLTRQLLAFARKQTIAPKVLDLNDAVGDMLKMLQRLIGEDIELAWETGANLWPVKMDPSQIDQILANLCVNARDAIGGVGKITIETDNVELDADCCAAHVDAVPGAYVMLAVSDTGCGIDRETLEHVFEPFFTTKGVGEGTGLGLATVHGIVKQNGGLVNVYSEPGKGTTFRIYLPQFAEETNEAETKDNTRPIEGGSETILLVEDEKSIRVTAEIFLQGYGYTVLAAEAPEKALQLAAEHPGRIHLLVTDVVMPGMSGKELAERLVGEFPDLKCLYMSGYTADVIACRGVLDENVEFMSKPFTRDALTRKVRDVLDESVG